MIKTIVVAVVAAGLGAVLALLAVGDFDLLSTPKNEVVVLRGDMVVRNSRGGELHLPAGTTLTFESQYADEATLELRVVTSKLDAFAPGSGVDTAYYAD
jgi:hypothetical protein